jgi:hypothetical protein
MATTIESSPHPGWNVDRVLELLHLHDCPLREAVQKLKELPSQAIADARTQAIREAGLVQKETNSSADENGPPSAIIRSEAGAAPRKRERVPDAPVPSMDRAVWFLGTSSLARSIRPAEVYNTRILHV